MSRPRGFGLSPRDFGLSPGRPGRAGHVSARGFVLSPRGFGLSPGRDARNHRHNTLCLVRSPFRARLGSFDAAAQVCGWKTAVVLAGFFIQKARWISGLCFRMWQSCPSYVRRCHRCACACVCVSCAHVCRTYFCADRAQPRPRRMYVHACRRRLGPPGEFMRCTA